jgi:hypothetical protein
MVWVAQSELPYDEIPFAVHACASTNGSYRRKESTRCTTLPLKGIRNAKTTRGGSREIGGNPWLLGQRWISLAAVYVSSPPDHLLFG